MLTFPSARRAVKCCIAIQTDLAEYASENPETGVRVRMGVHTGEAIVDEGATSWEAHHRGSPDRQPGRRGQILASGVTAEITSSRGDLTFSRQPRWS